MSNKSFFNLAIKVRGRVYCLASLSFNPEKNEFFYNFPFDLSKIIKCFRNNSWQSERMFEHVSFHRNGQIHLKYRNIKNKKQYTNIITDNINIFEFDDNAYTPLLIHSFYFKDFEPNGIFPEITSDNQTYILDIAMGKNFSIIPVIVGCKVSPLTVHKGFNDLNDSSLKPIFLREPLKSFKSEELLNKAPTTPSLCVLFSSKVNKPEANIESIVSKESGQDFSRVMSFGIAPPLSALDELI